MIRRFAGLAFVFAILSAGWSVVAQQAPATQQQPASQQPPPQTTPQQQQEQQRQEQQRQDQQRMADEQLRKDQEAERQRFVNSLPPAPTSVAKTAPPQVSEPCLPLELPRDQGFDLKEIPLEDWVAGPETHEIPWKLQVRSPELRLDQKYQVGYLGKIDSKDLNWSAGRHELHYVSGVSSPDGRYLVTPKSFRQLFAELPPNRFSVSFSDCVFLQPGQYVLWMAVYDAGSKRHSIFKRSIHLPEWPAETLPKLTAQLPPVEFPTIFGEARRNLQAFPGPFVLPVNNKPALKLQVISLLSPADQWFARADIVRTINNRVLSATGITSQITLAAGSVSTAVLDLTNRTTVFEQQEFRQLNWIALSSAFITASDAFKVGVPALEALKEHGTFFRESLLRRLDVQSAPMRVFIVISGSLSFAEESDVKPVNWEGDCNCRVYHLRLRLNKDDVFDDLAKLMKPLHPRTFDIRSPRDFRKALADIVEDLNKL